MGGLGVLSLHHLPVFTACFPSGLRRFTTLLPPPPCAVTAQRPGLAHTAVQASAQHQDPSGLQPHPFDGALTMTAYGSQ